MGRSRGGIPFLAVLEDIRMYLEPFSMRRSGIRGHNNRAVSQGCLYLQVPAKSLISREHQRPITADDFPLLRNEGSQKKSYSLGPCVPAALS